MPNKSRMASLFTHCSCGCWGKKICPMHSSSAADQHFWHPSDGWHWAQHCWACSHTCDWKNQGLSQCKAAWTPVCSSVHTRQFCTPSPTGTSSSPSLCTLSVCTPTHPQKFKLPFSSDWSKIQPGITTTAVVVDIFIAGLPTAQSTSQTAQFQVPSAHFVYHLQQHSTWRSASCTDCT